MRRVTRGHAVASAGSLNQHSGAAAWSILVVCFCNTTSDILRAGVCVHPVFKICLILFFIFFFCCLPQREPTQPHEYILFDILWAAWSWSSACSPALWIYYNDTKENYCIFLGGKHRAGWRGRGGADKNGWGRPRYYQTVLFISSFCKIGESRTQFYYFAPRLAAATVVTSRHQTAGSSMNRT